MDEPATATPTKARLVETLRAKRGEWEALVAAADHSPQIRAWLAGA